MTEVVYACGCRETRGYAASGLPWRCPIHGQPPRHTFTAGTQALHLMYGSVPAIPPDGLFYPHIEGRKA